MKILGFTVAGIVALVIAFLVGRHTPVPKPNPHDRNVMITGCEVDNAVVILDPQNSDRMQWVSTDNKPYWITFLQLREPLGSYVAQSPLVLQGHPGPDPVVLTPTNPSSPYFNVKADPKHGDPYQPDYYMYAIYNQDPADQTIKPCKKASDERDTGVIVKR